MALFDRFISNSNLKNMTKKGDVDGLIDALNDENPNIRKHAAINLKLFDDSRVVEPLINALKDDKARVRKQAARTLGVLSDERAVDPLIVALNDDDLFVVEESVKSLAEIGDNRAVEPLIKTLNSHHGVSNVCTTALGMLGDERAIDPIITTHIKRATSFVLAGYSLKKIGGKLEPSPMAQKYYDQVINRLMTSNLSMKTLTSWDLWDYKYGKDDNIIVPCVIGVTEDFIADYAVLIAGIGIKGFVCYFKEFSSVNISTLDTFTKNLSGNIFMNYNAVAIVNGVDSETIDALISEKHSSFDRRYIIKVIYDLKSKKLYYSKDKPTVGGSYYSHQFKMIEKYLQPSEKSKIMSVQTKTKKK